MRAVQPLLQLAKAQEFCFARHSVCTNGLQMWYTAQARGRRSHMRALPGQHPLAFATAACAAANNTSPPCVAAVEQAADAVKGAAKDLEEAQKMPALDEESDRLTKDGLFYQAQNQNVPEVDADARVDPGLSDKPAPDMPFGETGSKGAARMLADHVTVHV